MSRVIPWQYQFSKERMPSSLWNFSNPLVKSNIWRWHILKRTPRQTHLGLLQTCRDPWPSQVLADLIAAWLSYWLILYGIWTLFQIKLCLNTTWCTFGLHSFLSNLLSEVTYYCYITNIFKLLNLVFLIMSVVNFA